MCHNKLTVRDNNSVCFYVIYNFLKDFLDFKQVDV